MPGIGLDVETESPTSRNARFYQDFVVFQVENELFRVLRQPFQRHSRVFSDMFEIPQGEGTIIEGLSDDNPIRLEGYRKIDFENLLTILVPNDSSVLHPVALSEMGKTDWISILKLATTWDMPEIRDLAVSYLDKQLTTPIEYITLAREYRVPKWFIQGCASLVNTGLETGSSSERMNELGEKLGWATLVRILSVTSDVLRDKATKRPSEVTLSSLACKDCSISNLVIINSRDKTLANQLVLCRNCDVSAHDATDMTAYRTSFSYRPPDPTGSDFQDPVSLIKKAFREEIASLSGYENNPFTIDN